MTTKVFTTMQMEVPAKSDPEIQVPLTIVKDDEGNVELTLSGKYKAVILDSIDVTNLSKFLKASEAFIDG